MDDRLGAPCPIGGKVMSGQTACHQAQDGAGRLVLHPPCCDTPIVLARETTDLQLVHDVACQPCERGWRVAFLGDHRLGLWVCWQPARTRS